MKYPKLTTILIASTLLMPAIGSSQTSGSSSQTQTRPSGSSSSQSSQSGTTGSTGTSSSMRSSTSSATSPQSWSSTSMSGASNLQRISEDELENRVTASNLIGKTVKDQSGETIGEVKDIGLTHALQGSSSSSRYSSTTGSTGSARVSGGMDSTGVSGTARVGDTTATGSIDSSGVSGSTSRTGTSGTSSDLSQASRDLASSAASMLGQSDVSIIIEVEDADAFVAVPASELRYDQSKEELTIQRSLSELQQVAQGSQTSSASRAAE